jgi:hypothetical protein
MYRNKLPHVGKHALVYRCNECLAGRIHQALQSGVGGLLVSYTRHCTKASYNVPCRPSRARSVMCANLRWRSMLGGNRVATFVWSIGSVGYRWHCRLRLHALSLTADGIQSHHQVWRVQHPRFDRLSSLLQAQLAAHQPVDLCNSSHDLVVDPKAGVPRESLVRQVGLATPNATSRVGLMVMQSSTQ